MLPFERRMKQSEAAKRDNIIKLNENQMKTMQQGMAKLNRIHTDSMSEIVPEFWRWLAGWLPPDAIFNRMKAIADWLPHSRPKAQNRIDLWMLSRRIHFAYPALLLMPAVIIGDIFNSLVVWPLLKLKQYVWRFGSYSRLTMEDQFHYRMRIYRWFKLRKDIIFDWRTGSTVTEFPK